MRTGHFLLESGHHGERWLELDRLFLRPKELMPFVTELSGRVATQHPEVVCGPLVGGAFLAQLIAAELELGFCFAERIVTERQGLYPVDYRIPAALRQSIVNKRVALIDDAISAGSACRATLAELREAQAACVVLAALISIGDAARNLAKENGLAFESLWQLPDTVWPPAQCPMCALGAPLSSA